MRISREWIASQTFDIVGNGREIRLNCPNCDDSTKHLYVNQDRQKWYCFKCSKGGMVERKGSIEQDLSNFRQVIIKQMHVANESANQVNSEMFKDNTIKSLPLNCNLPHIEIAEDASCSAELQARNYLHKRGVTQVEINLYNIRASLEKSGPYKNTVIFPVYNSPLVYKGESIFEDKVNPAYFVCRKWDGSKPRYVNAPWPKNYTLFITSTPALPGPFNSAVIVEGILDAIAIGRVGYVGIALLGKKATAQQLNRLSRIYKHYTIYLDNDALTQAVELKLQLNALGVSATLIRNKSDAADLAYNDVQSLIRLLKDGS